MGRLIRRIPPVLALVCAVGAALRFFTLDVQSLWYDEAITAQLLAMDLGGLLRAIPDSESTPPLYYLLAWFWTHVFGTGEIGMRSLSALLGTATIAVVWALGRRLGGKRAAVIAAALAAANPMLVWFSQEARAYALLALLAALAALLWLRVLAQPKPRYAAAWSLVAVLALATHYYAVFLVGPMALWLAVRLPTVRLRTTALAPVILGLAALAPLALAQRANDGAAFIGDSSLLTRTAQLPKQLLVGYDAPGEVVLSVLLTLALVVAIGGVVLIVRAHGSSDVGPLAAITAAAIVLPVLAAIAGEDHLITRNLLAVAPLGAALAGAGLGAVARSRARRLPWLGRSAIAAGCVLGLVAVIGVNSDPDNQRDDWRGAVAALGHADGERLLAATPSSGLAPLRYYLPGVRPLVADAILTSEIDFVALSEHRVGRRGTPPRPDPAPMPAPGFVLVDRTEAQSFTVLRLRAPAPLPVASGSVALGLDGKPAALLVATR